MDATFNFRTKAQAKIFRKEMRAKAIATKPLNDYGVIVSNCEDIKVMSVAQYRYNMIKCK